MKEIPRLILATAIISVLVLLSYSTVLGSGYLAPTPGVSPHGSFATTTNKCKQCHAVHLAVGGYRLLRNNSAATACEYCHGASGVANKKPVTLDANGHGTIQNPTVYAPDDTDPRYNIAATSWGCASCHSVHGNNVITWFANESWSSGKILKQWPNTTKGSGGTYTDYNNGGTSRLSNWCSSCHNANIGLHTLAKTSSETTPSGTVYGHDASASGGTNASATYGNTGTWSIVATDSVNNGPMCKQCHRGNGDTTATAAGVGFPHSSGNAPDLLDVTSTASGNGLDAVCLSCHSTTGLP